MNYRIRYFMWEKFAYFCDFCQKIKLYTQNILVKYIFLPYVGLFHHTVSIGWVCCQKYNPLLNIKFHFACNSAAFNEDVVSPNICCHFNQIFCWNVIMQLITYVVFNLLVFSSIYLLFFILHLILHSLQIDTL